MKALQGVEEMRKNVDALLIVNNERLCDVYADSEITVKDAFKLADKVLSDATKSISEMITRKLSTNFIIRYVTISNFKRRKIPQKKRFQQIHQPMNPQTSLMSQPHSSLKLR